MGWASTHAVVHLELHTGTLPRACGFYARLFALRPEPIEIGSGSHLALDWGKGIEGTVVEHRAAMWLAYVACDISAATDHARELGAPVILEPRKGAPAGAASWPRPPGLRWRCGSRSR